MLISEIFKLARHLFNVKKPYIKKYCEVAGFSVWIVDGKYIRENIDEEFTNFGQHFRFRFVPKNEFWIDKTRQGGEEQFYIDHMIAENRMMSEGKDYYYALKMADKIEKRERSTVRFIKNLKKSHKENVIKRIHKKLLKKYSNKINVWVVKGDLVRSMFFIDFTEGGHDMVYSFIPKNEIWLDDDLSEKEMKFILLHEMHERNLMAHGWPYDLKSPIRVRNNKPGKIKKSAHRSASEIEHFARVHSGTVDKFLRKEMKEE